MQTSTPDRHANGGAGSGGEGPISVFLVDDVPELRELIRFGIEEDPGFKVVGEAGDGASALQGIAETHPAAVLLDLSMPDMDGLEAIPEIRSREPGAAIVVLSGFSANRMEKAARDRGADGYVEKGTSLAELREVTRNAVTGRAG
ncbi:MAG: response regulator transcription factor [Actinomycetota bacterium]|nr:response regulator transcription factor [Actinomycetota bacterium]